jgi:hypothetical protein
MAPLTLILMGIDLLWTDANGAKLDFAGDAEFHFADLVTRIRDDRASTFVAIRRIDPYGTTRFSPPQVTALLHELESLRNQAADPAVSTTLGHYLSVIRAAEGATGTWLEFDGD